MTNIVLFKSTAVENLYNSVEENIEIYRSGSFEHLLRDSSLFLNSSCVLDDELAQGVTCTSEDDNEVGACLAIYKSLTGVNKFLARDPRLWVRLSHIEFINYSRCRWSIPKDDQLAASHIRKHFFAKGSRGIERDHAISRLWWMADICDKVNNLTLEQSLTAFLFQSDVRANIVERPSTSQNPLLLSTIINKLYLSYQTDDKSLYERSRFRTFMKNLNLEGGVKLLEVLDETELDVLLTASLPPLN